MMKYLILLASILCFVLGLWPVPQNMTLGPNVTKIDPHKFVIDIPEKLKINEDVQDYIKMMRLIMFK